MKGEGLVAITWELKRTVAEPSLRGNPFETHSQDQQLSLSAVFNGWEATIVPDSGYLVIIRNVLGVMRKRCRYATETEAMMVAENMLRDFGRGAG